MKAWLASLSALEFTLVALCSSIVATAAITAAIVLTHLFKPTPLERDDEP